MKNILCFTVCLALVLALSAPAHAIETVPEDTLAISSPSAILIEKTTGEIIYEKNARTEGAPASVTKVMTLLLIAEAVEDGTIGLDDYVTGSKKASGMGGSQVWLEEGEKMTVSDMLKCIAVVSANDCAVAMAEHISGSEEAFVQKMNARAAELGCESTSFKNCTGLFEDPDHYTSAYDIALMSRALISHDWIKDYTSIWMDSIRNGEFGLSNTNKLVYYYDGCTGLKTGFTSKAMYCLAATAERDGVEFIAVIMHGESIEKRNDDAKALLSFGFANYSLCSLRAAEALPPVKVSLGSADSVQPEYSGCEMLLLKKSEAKDISYSLNLPEDVPAPVKAGSALGTLTVYSGGSVIAEIPLVAGSEVSRLGVLQIFKLLLNMVFSCA